MSEKIQLVSGTSKKAGVLGLLLHQELGVLGLLLHQELVPSSRTHWPMGPFVWKQQLPP